MKDGCKSQVTNFNLPKMAIDEYVITFKISMDYRRIMAMKIS